MHFYFFRYLTMVAMRGWFRKFYVHFEQKLPSNVPILYASTHPNSVIDFMPAPITTNHPVNVLVRGDVFENNFLNKIFRAFWMLPVYRIRDGYASLSRNDDSFRECFSAFDKNEHVLIFTEGVSVQEKQIQPLKKGTAKLALDYLFKHGGKEILVVPTTTNYTHFRKFRASMTTFFGMPIKGSQYKELYETNANQAYEKLTADITAEMKKHFIEQKDFQDDSLTEKALEALRLNRLDDRAGWQIEDTSFSDEEAKLVNVLNEKGESVLSEQFKTLSKKLNLNHRNEGLLKAKFGRDFYLLQTVILWPIVQLTSLSLAVPYFVVRWLLKNKIKDKIFHDTVVVFGHTLIYLFQSILLIIIGLSVFGLSGLLIPAVTIICTYIWIAIIDEYTFAKYNWKNVSSKAEYKRLYDEVAALMA